MDLKILQAWLDSARDLNDVKAGIRWRARYSVWDHVSNQYKQAFGIGSWTGGVMPLVDRG